MELASWIGKFNADGPFTYSERGMSLTMKIPAETTKTSGVPASRCKLTTGWRVRTRRGLPARRLRRFVEGPETLILGKIVE